MERRLISAETAFTRPFSLSNARGFAGFAILVGAVGAILFGIQRFFESFAGLSMVNGVFAPVMSGSGILVPAGSAVHALVNTALVEPLTALSMFVGLCGALLLTGLVIRYMLNHQQGAVCSVPGMQPSLMSLVHYYFLFLVLGATGFGAIKLAGLHTALVPFISVAELFISVWYLVALFAIFNKGMNVLQALQHGWSVITGNLASFVLLLGGLAILNELQQVILSPFATLGQNAVMVLSVAVFIVVLYVRLMVYASAYQQATE